MKITLPMESAALLIEVKQLSGKSFNSLIKESILLLLQKQLELQNNQPKDHNVHYQISKSTN